jgi:hypothetical protein
MGERGLAHAAEPRRGVDMVERDFSVGLHRADPEDPSAVDVKVIAGQGDGLADFLGRLIGQPIGEHRLIGAVIGAARFCVGAARGPH